MCFVYLWPRRICWICVACGRACVFVYIIECANWIVFLFPIVRRIQYSHTIFCLSRTETIRRIVPVVIGSFDVNGNEFSIVSSCRCRHKYRIFINRFRETLFMQFVGCSSLHWPKKKLKKKRMIIIIYIDCATNEFEHHITKKKPQTPHNSIKFRHLYFLRPLIVDC